MNDRIDRMPGEDPIERHPIPNVRLDERRHSPCDSFDPAEHRGRTVAQIVDNDGCPARSHDLDTRVRADEAGGASEENNGHELLETRRTIANTDRRLRHRRTL